MRTRAGVALVLALTAARPASAADEFNDPYDLPAAPRPPTLPELTHPDVEASFEETIGFLRPNPGNPSWTKASAAYVQRIGLESPIWERRWFAGATYEAALGAPPETGGAAKLVSGNVELYGRTLWATRTGL